MQDLGFLRGIFEFFCLWSDYDLCGPFLVVLMGDTVDKKPVLKSEVVSMMSKITDPKLNGLNYLEWSKTI